MMGLSKRMSILPMVLFVSVTLWCESARRVAFHMALYQRWS
jgi:hypothetical protein